MEGYRTAEDLGEYDAQRGKRYQAASIFQEEICRQIDTAALDSSAPRVAGELTLQIVIAKFPLPPAGLSRHLAQGLENFQQSYIVPVIPFEYRQGIISYHRVDGNPFVLRNARQRCGQNCDQETWNRDPPEP